MLGTKRKTALLGSASAVALLVAAAPAQAQTEVEVSGYVKGDAIYDFSGGTIGDTANMGAIPLEGTAKEDLDGHFRAHARQTRFRITTNTDSAFGDLKTYIEGDFFGGGGNEFVSNSSAFRLRHAYGSLGPLLVGQTWSNFTRFHYPATVDFFGPQGALFKRQGQVRYTFDASPEMQVAVSIENDENLGPNGGAETVGPSGSIDELPAFVIMADYNSGGTSVSLGGILRKLYFDDGATDDDDTGYGVHIGASQQVLGRDTIYAEFTYGEGIGSYLNGIIGDSQLVGGDLKAIEMWGYDVGFTHVWSDTAESNIVWGQYQNEDSDDGGANALERTRSLHVNYMWHPVPRVTLGLEYIYGSIKVDNETAPITDDTNDHHRVQFGAQYRF